ncbi:MAG: late competence development ComFB family protein [Syntrophomonas sp.]|uniref:late competence development ComFB family protein n=1 Tax=Syntrophomonas sp. TaxID=2053627 RepID=UPI00262B5247|nr:late competence development ComFB family protein [Syntrophomonas sp.]MDD2510056.1 late competence development ComFB family protein [Syntrophomonas sp.]MDD3879008.1 late competence development ComFB family protein [Syntrophomonas sp.]MDD4626766.1 late competence development ComFB family protein [Syntrophomonas sp.]
MEIGNMRVINIVEELVWECINEVIEHRPGKCRCDRCIADICALALNQMKPRYVASDRGKTISKAAFLEKDLKIALLVVVADAVERVNANPRHGVE